MPADSGYNNLISWSLSCGMRSTYSANATFVNQGSYDTTMLFEVLRVHLNCEAVAAGIDPTPFNSDVRWVNGVITSVEQAEGISQRGVVFGVSSFFAKLDKKPVNTEEYNDTAENVLEELASIYGGIPSGLYSFAASDCIINAVISGNSLLDAMRMVAQAAGQDLFVRHDGILVTEDWKDNTSGVDLVLTREAIISARLQVTENMGPSRIKVRGKFQTQMKEGKQDLLDSGTNPAGGGNGGGGGGGGGGGRPQKKSNNGKQGVCIKNGVPMAEALAKLRNLRGNAEDLKNSELLIQNGGAEFGGFQQVYDNGVDVTLLPEGIEEFFGVANDEQVQMQMLGNVRPQNEFRGAASLYGPYRETMARRAAQQRALQEYLAGGGKALPLPLGGGGGGGGQHGGGPAGNTHKDKMADESEILQIETTVDDPDLQAEYGVVVEEINNEYLSTYEQMFAAAVRRFQEFKMSRAAWDVESAYLPLLRLNQVVTFTRPDNAETITGLVTSLSVDCQPGPAVRMRFTLESFEQMGATAYSSGNMVMHQKLRAVDNESHWFTNDEMKVRSSHGLVNFSSTSGAPLDLTQEMQVTVGKDYTLTFDVGKTGSDGSVVALVTDSIGTLATGSTISVDTLDVTVTFTARERLTTIRFDVSTGTDTDFTVSGVKLVQNRTA